MRQLSAPAKINLALHVGAVQSDGYHPVDTLCVFVDIGETVSVIAPSHEFSLTISGPEAGGLTAEADNLILRGARHVAALTGAEPCTLDLNKTAPIASGIGAGTSDGAAAMVLINQRANAPLSDEALLRESIVLGADGPICMARLLRQGQLIRARGIGEDITISPDVGPVYVCLANPRQSISTGAVFRAFDTRPVPKPFAILPPTRGLSAQGLAAWMMEHRNDLAPIARSLEPAISTLEYAMLAQPGALAARMSGSGATVFGLFSDLKGAARAAIYFKGQGAWAVAGPAIRSAVGKEQT